MAYKQTFNDHCYLWKIAPARDMTGGYVDQEDLDRMLKNPTKKQATNCLEDQIDYWFQIGPDLAICASTQGAAPWWRDRRVKAIARRYYMEDEQEELRLRNEQPHDQ